METEPKKGTRKWKEWKYQQDLPRLLVRIRENYEFNLKKWNEENELRK